MFAFWRQALLDSLSDLVLEPEWHVNIHPVFETFVFVVEAVEGPLDLHHALLHIVTEHYKNVSILLAAFEVNTSFLDLLEAQLHFFRNILASRNSALAVHHAVREVLHGVLHLINLRHHALLVLEVLHFLSLLRLADVNDLLLGVLDDLLD